MSLKKIQSQPLHEKVYEELLKEIISGGIVPGARITLKEIADQLGVSSMPVREAVRKLQAGNLVTLENRRITVKKLSTEYLSQVLEMRMLLEAYAGEKAAWLVDEASLRELEKLHHALAKTKEEFAFLKMNHAFHEAIYRQARIPIIMELIGILWEKVSPYQHIWLREQKAFHFAGAVEIHARILDGLRNKNPREVRKWLEKDLSESTHQVMLRLEPDSVPAV